MPDEIVIDERFYRPPNVVDLRGKNQEDGSVYYGSGDTATDTIPDIGSEIPTGTAPVAPTSFTVVSQMVRTTEDGKQVVDLVLELPDQPGVREYDIRLAKF